MKKWKGAAASAAVFIGLLAGCLWFVGWIGKLAFQNTYIEQKEQVILQEAGEMIDEIEYGIRFGKTLYDYYGIEAVLDKLCGLAPAGGSAQAALLDPQGLPLSASFLGGELEREYTARILSRDFQEKLSDVSGQEGAVLDFGRMKSMVFPICAKDGGVRGNILLFYDTSGFLRGGSEGGMFLLSFAVILAAGAVYLLAAPLLKARGLYRWTRIFPMAAILSGIVLEMLMLFVDYRDKYEAFMYDNVEEICQNIGDKTKELLDKGLSPDQLNRLEEYYIGTAQNNDFIWNIRINHSYLDTAGAIGRADKDTLVTKAGDVDVLITVNRQFITRQMGNISLSFAALFIICSMLSYELIKLIDIIKLQRRDRGEPLGDQACAECLPLHIKLFSFLVYTGIYISMPYAAVLMMSWNASVWGLPMKVSSSLPLSIELTGILFFSFLIPKVCGKMKVSLLAACSLAILVAGNLGCLAVTNPYSLIAMRCVCSLGFALFKYLMNSLVAAGGGRIEKNAALMNAGLLGGITVGGSIGSVLAGAKGYQFNYGATALTALAALGGAFLFLPFREIQERRNQEKQVTRKAGIRLGRVLRDPAVVKVLILGDIPLNIGLMYVVAFLPVYMEHIGRGGLAVSYAYLINGLCGVYLGVFLVRALKKARGRAQMVITMLVGACGILILSSHGGLFVVLFSAALMGIFDGYGTPGVTGYFTGMPQVKKLDAAQMLTVFGIVGSAVQIICPLFYNLIIGEGESTGRLMALGAGYIAVAFLIVFLIPKETGKGE